MRNGYRFAAGFGSLSPRGTAFGWDHLRTWRGQPFDYATVKELANPAPPRGPALRLSGVPDLRVYDSLLAGVA